MFYKVVKDGKIIDVLDRLIYLKYQKKHDRMILCQEDEAQAIISSDEKYIWHVDGLYDLPVNRYDTVRLEKIDQYEYEELQLFNLSTREDLIDAFTLSLIKDGVI